MNDKVPAVIYIPESLHNLKLLPCTARECILSLSHSKFPSHPTPKTTANPAYLFIPETDLVTWFRRIYLFILSLSSASNGVLQEKMLSQSAWKDYSTNGHHTNYAYEHFDPSAVDAEMKQSKASNGHGAHPGRYAASNGSSANGGGGRGRNGAPMPQSMQQPHNGGPGSTYSLPRVNGNGAGYTTSPMGVNGGGMPPPPPNGGYPPHPSAYGSYDRRLPHGGYGHHPAAAVNGGRPDYAPDHYFMPSQRKYSGENIRVYVDYNK